MKVKATQIVENAYNMAQYASIVIAGDYGYANEIKEIPGGYSVEVPDKQEKFIFLNK